MNHDEGLDQGNPWTEDPSGYCLECEEETALTDSVGEVILQSFRTAESKGVRVTVSNE